MSQPIAVSTGGGETLRRDTGRAAFSGARTTTRPVPVTTPHSVSHGRLLVGGRQLLIVLTLLSATMAMQIASGVLHSERASYSDEAAHFMNGLVLRDYVKDGLGENPITFAERYYVSYPKIAIGMWPPLFHTALGLFMLLVGPPQLAAFLLVALVNTWAAWRLYTIVAFIDTQLTALILAGAFVLATANLGLTTAIMLDLPIAALTLEATYRLAVFVVRGSCRAAASFGFFTALCCLTKGNGLSIVLVPGLLVVMTGRYDLLLARRFQAAALIVAILAGPVVFMSFRLDAAIGDFGWVSATEMLHRTTFYLSYLWTQLGALVISLSTIAIVASSWRRPGTVPTLSSTLKVALAAQVVAALSFHILNPHLSIGSRYITLAIPPLLALTAVGTEIVTRFIRERTHRESLRLAVIIAAVLLCFVSQPVEAKRVPIGAAQTVDFLESHGGLANLTMLVVSDERGEGAMVSEVALRHPVPEATIVRASKLIAADDWSGHHFTMLYSSSSDLLRRLEDLHVGYLVVDSSASGKVLPYWHLVNELITSNPNRVERIYSTTTVRDFVTYRLKYQSPGTATPLEIPLTYSLGRALSK